jgi:hypothetical protein
MNPNEAVEKLLEDLEVHLRELETRTQAELQTEESAA